MYQPFGTAFLVGAEVDFIKFRSHAVALDIPLPGLNEVFVLLLMKKMQKSISGTVEISTIS